MNEYSFVDHEDLNGAVSQGWEPNQVPVIAAQIVVAAQNHINESACGSAFSSPVREHQTVTGIRQQSVRAVADDHREDTVKTPGKRS